MTHLNHFVLSWEKAGFSLRHLCLPGACAFKSCKTSISRSFRFCVTLSTWHILTHLISDVPTASVNCLHSTCLFFFSFYAETLCTHKRSGTRWAKWYWLKWNWLTQCFNKEPVYHRACPFLLKCVFLKELLNRADNLSHSCLQRAFLTFLGLPSL